MINRNALKNFSFIKLRMDIPPRIEYISTLVIAVIYAFAYSLFDPEEFGFKSAIDPLYFSMTTMSTAGYGDFSPKTTRTKLLVMTQQAIMLVSSMALALKIFGLGLY